MAYRNEQTNLVVSVDERYLRYLSRCRCMWTLTAASFGTLRTWRGRQGLHRSACNVIFGSLCQQSPLWTIDKLPRSTSSGGGMSWAFGKPGVLIHWFLQTSFELCGCVWCSILQRFVNVAQIDCLDQLIHVCERVVWFARKILRQKVDGVAIHGKKRSMFDAARACGRNQHRTSQQYLSYAARDHTSILSPSASVQTHLKATTERKAGLHKFSPP
jgi:hypothetical protein